jgi:hypothetical protein
VSQTKTKREAISGNAMLKQARGVVVMAVPVSQRAGSAAAQGMQRGMHRARSWSAPRLEGFAEAVESGLAPALTSKLRQGAQMVKPEQKSRLSSMRRSAMSRTGLAALLAVLAAAGAAAGFMLRKRLTDAVAEDDLAEEDTDSVSVPSQADNNEAVTEDRKIGSAW